MYAITFDKMITEHVSHTFFKTLLKKSQYLPLRYEYSRVFVHANIGT